MRYVWSLIVAFLLIGLGGCVHEDGYAYRHHHYHHRYYDGHHHHDSRYEIDVYHGGRH